MQDTPKKLGSEACTGRTLQIFSCVLGDGQPAMGGWLSQLSGEGTAVSGAESPELRLCGRGEVTLAGLSSKGIM